MQAGAASLRYRPDSHPPASGLYVSVPMPFRSVVGRTSASMPRTRIEYGGCSVTNRSRFRSREIHCASTIWWDPEYDEDGDRHRPGAGGRGGGRGEGGLERRDCPAESHHEDRRLVVVVLRLQRHARGPTTLAAFS